MINLSSYSMKSLSDFTHIASQAAEAGFPIAVEVLQAVNDAHATKLRVVKHIAKLKPQPDNIDMLNLSIYSRKTLSDWLQMAQQSTDILRPLPCWLVEHVAEAHDAKIKNDYLFICSICKKGIKKPKNTILLECGKKICKECYERI